MFCECGKLMCCNPAPFRLFGMKCKSKVKSKGCKNASVPNFDNVFKFCYLHGFDFQVKLKLMKFVLQ